MSAPPIVLRTLRGTGEPFQGNTGPLGAQPDGTNGFNMMDDITRRAASLGVAHYPVPYYASIAPAGGTKMFHESYADGYRRAQLADADGHPTIWAFYSLGALIGGDLLAAGALGNCVGAILISDPMRHSKQIDPECKVNRAHYGCVDRRFITTTTEFHQISAPDDPISALAATNGFRTLAQAITGVRQPWNVGFLDLNATLDAVRRYLGTPPNAILRTPARPSRHVIYNSEKMPGSTKTYTGHAADLVEQMIRRHRAA
ncbi:lysin B [Gordonia phage Patio]|uniref:Lysin B n=2 Tax=Skysandvirus TaxID=2948912 RepID=A0A2D2W4T1_9CAUD|nr:lysin B [Gordonia phage Patio]YP_010098088.1 lysin B [Gordonia phage Skysand]ATS93103.1 lysin B [Gordonia phage Patio]AXQ62054.1 lysin B [Gordonia phage Skysand]QXN74403.1 lysin B [Gordonia phage Float294]